MTLNQFERWIRSAAVYSLALIAPAAAMAGTALHLEVLRGEGSNNNALHGPASSPIVRVLDDSGHPLVRVLVVFSPPVSGASVVFAGFEAEASTFTDESGVAVAPRARPSGGNGPVEIQVLASHAGEFANCVIHQMNLGIGGDAAREGELDVVRLQPPSQAGRPSNKVPGLAVRVEDAKGNPVALASVLFVLRLIEEDGDRAEELSRTSATTDQNGEAFGEIPKRFGNKTLEFMVEVTEHCRRATRFFRMN